MIITGAIFDMDGTLLNSMDYWVSAADEYLLRRGITPIPESGRGFFDLGMKSWYEYAKIKYGISEEFEAVSRGIYDVIDEKYATCVEVKHGAREMLDALKQRGVKMCLATATDRASVELILNKLDLAKYFDRIFTCKEVGAGKRYPLIYERALEFLGTPKESTYVFEDAFYAMTTAYDNGFKVVGVYDKNVLESESEIKEKCHVYLDKNSKYKLDID